jgi:ribonuclease P protein component
MQQIRLGHIPRTGPRKSRREAVVRAKKGGLLFVCLGFKRSEFTQDTEVTQINYAIVTSKKSVSKRAVVRNKCKRRTRAALLCLRNDPNFLERLDKRYEQMELLIVHQRDSSESVFAEFQAHLSEGLLRLTDNLNSYQSSKNNECI